MSSRIARWLRGLADRLWPRPESTFIRVAYSTPRQVLLVTARHGSEETVWPIDGHVVLSFVPPVFGIVLNPGGFGAELVRRSGAFVVNFVAASERDLVLRCGALSGRGIDKLAALGIAREPAQTVDVPRLAGGLGVLECRVRQTLDVGDHVLVVGDVLHAAMREDAPRLHHLDRRVETSAASWERSPGELAPKDEE